MPETPNSRKQSMKVTMGPVQPESVLYRILQWITREIIKSLEESRGITNEAGRQSRGRRVQ
jgi:hypothetical protein